MVFYTTKPILMTLRITLLPEASSAFVDWQSKFNSEIASFPGFVSLEILSPFKNQKDWLVIQRFTNKDEASSWRNSTKRKHLIGELKNITLKKGIEETTTDEEHFHEGVTEVIVTEVAPENERNYREWTARMHHAEAKFPGFRGVYVQAPHGHGKAWITLLQFDNVQNLDNWLNSSARKKILEEAAPLVSSIETHRVISPYAGWFSSLAKEGQLPPVWKQTMIVLLVLFPIVMLEIKYLNPFTQFLGPSLSTFIANAISVTLLSFPLVPIAIWFLGWWLTPNYKKPLLKTILGTFFILGLYLFEIILFWNFLLF